MHRRGALRDGTEQLFRRWLVDTVKHSDELIIDDRIRSINPRLTDIVCISGIFRDTSFDASFFFSSSRPLLNNRNEPRICIIVLLAVIVCCRLCYYIIVVPSLGLCVA